MKPAFLLDEQISPWAAGELRKAGLNARAVAGSSLAGSGDREVFQTAIEEGRVLVTYNIKDMTLLACDFAKEGLDVPGMVLIDRRTIPSSDLVGLVRALVKLGKEIDNGDVDPAGGIFLRR